MAGLRLAVAGEEWAQRPLEPFCGPRGEGLDCRYARSVVLRHRGRRDSLCVLSRTGCEQSVKDHYRMHVNRAWTVRFRNPAVKVCHLTRARV